MTTSTQGTTEIPVFDTVIPHIDLLPEFQGRECRLDEELSEALGCHWYRVDGVDYPLPSVTAILHIINKSDVLIPWATRMAAKYIRDTIRTNPVPAFRNKGHLLKWLEPVLASAQTQHARVAGEAASIGTEDHQAVELHLLGQLPLDQVSRLELPAVEGALRFLDREGLTPVYPEFPSWNRLLDYAGTVDCPAVNRNNALVVVDWKTSPRLYEEYDYQVAAYSATLEQMTGREVEDAFTVRLPKRYPEHPPYGSRRIEDLPGKYETFLAAFKLWRDVTKDMPDEYRRLSVHWRN